MAAVPFVCSVCFVSVLFACPFPENRVIAIFGNVFGKYDFSRNMFRATSVLKKNQNLTLYLRFFKP